MQRPEGEKGRDAFVGLQVLGYGGVWEYRAGDETGGASAVRGLWGTTVVFK